MAMGQFATEKVYDDLDSATLDAIPSQKLHRNVDVTIADAHKQGGQLGGIMSAGTDISFPL